uniref:B30.2/SPRY domain-containing protein n=1 Tax=Gadus morhua TaxID=8049 RepID=A0A8C5AH41_GADMO
DKTLTLYGDRRLISHRLLVNSTTGLLSVRQLSFFMFLKHCNRNYFCVSILYNKTCIFLLCIVFPDYRFLKKNFFETLNMEMKKLRDDAELKRVQQYEVDVTLDPDTAHPNLILSEDWKQVHDGGVGKIGLLPDNPKRFTKYMYVLTRQSFSSGRFYFEVQVKDKTSWWLGVARESINRKGQKKLTPENALWTLHSYKDGFIFQDDPNLQKVGVFVDYDEGLVSFYDVEARVHIYSATGSSFTEPLYPILSPCLHEGGINTTPLIISPVNQAD